MTAGFPRSVRDWQTLLYSNLLRIRPTQLGAALKEILGVKRRCIQARRHTFFADPASNFGLELWRHGVYEPAMTVLVETLLRPCDTFLDIGANEGYFSVLAATLVGPSGRVHCIEPQTRLQPIIRRNVSLNGAESVVVHALALAEVEGEVELFLRPSTNTGASSLFRHWRIGSTRQLARATTVDSFVRAMALPKVRLAKIDCEGAERAIVRGATSTLNDQLFEFIALEYHPQIIGPAGCEEVHRKLIDSGYVLTKVRGRCVYHVPGREPALRPAGELQTNCGWED